MKYRICYVSDDCYRVQYKSKKWYHFKWKDCEYDENNKFKVYYLFTIPEIIRHHYRNQLLTYNFEE